MPTKGFLTPDNIYYESEKKFNEEDIEIPLRPSEDYIWTGREWIIDRRKRRLDYVEIERMDHDHHKNKKDGLFENISWKDLITILYFIAGLVGMWIHMSERTLILEQKIAILEKDIATLKEDNKEFTTKFDNQIRQLSNQTSELSLLLMRINTDKK